MTSGAVVRAADVHADRTTTGASVRTLLGAGSDIPCLTRRLVDVPPQSQFEGIAGAAGELWFVIDGTGQLDVDDHPVLSLRADAGVWLPPGARFRLNADGPADLRVDAVTLPAASLPAAIGPPGHHPSPHHPGPPLARHLRDCEVETTGDRQFRVLFGPGRDCAVATQFAGEIPPGRAPDHSHPYDELVLVLEGEGVLHLDGTDHVVTAGTCAHLPPGKLHCMENTGTTTMRVLGVFHPADSPAAKTQFDQP
jgi:mannose-6-phosphate isomerase-like protein (cupin superfamily)